MMRKVRFRKIGVGMSLIIMSSLVGGCTMRSGAVSYIKDSIKAEIVYKDVNVSTEEDMKAYALERLQEKYNQTFEIEEIINYDHKNGEEDMPMNLTGRGHVVGDESLYCYFEVIQPHGFKDDYATNYYKDDITEYVKKGLKGISSDYELYINHHLTVKTYDPKMDYKEYLQDGLCCIDYTAYVDESEDYHTYIPLIREWMDALYTADYKWYLKICSRQDNDKLYFTLDPGDYGFNSSDDWDDEKIYDSIVDNVKYWELFDE